MTFEYLDEIFYGERIMSGMSRRFSFVWLFRTVKAVKRETEREKVGKIVSVS